MNKISSRILIVTLCLAAAFLVMRTADSKIVTNVPADLSGEELKAIVVDDFENIKVAANVDDDGWFVSSTPKAYTGGDDNMKKLKNHTYKRLAKRFFSLLDSALLSICLIRSKL